MKVLLISDGTFVARHSARRLVDLGHVVMDVRREDLGASTERAAATADEIAERAETYGYDRVLCLFGGSGLAEATPSAPFPRLLERATQLAQRRGARFVLASALPRVASARAALLRYEQEVARTAARLGLDAGVCRLEGLYGGFAEPGERHSLISSLVTAGITASPLQIEAPWDALHWPLHVRDAVDGIVRMLERSGPAQVELAGAVPYRTRDLVATVEAVLGGPMSLVADRLDERRSTRPPQIADARRLLRWRPQVGLFAGVEEQAFSEATRLDG